MDVVTYGGRNVTALSDAELGLAKTDCQNTLTRIDASPVPATYKAYRASVAEMLAGIDAEIARRGKA